MKKGQFFLSLLMLVVLVFSAFSTAVCAAQEKESETEHLAAYYEEIQSNQIPGWPQGEAVDSKAAVLMEANTGAVLYAKNMEEELPPASITKIMTALVALENGSLDDVVVFSQYAVNSIEYGSSHLGLTEGEELTLEQCLYGIMLASANEISNAVAEHIGGNIKNFTDMMNARAAQIGCTHTHFVNAHGLSEEGHYVCARDMALIMREALKNQKFREIIGTVEYEYPKTNLVDEPRYFMNHHKMISETGMLYDGCIGGKNGFTDEAGNTLVTAAARDGLTLISVVLQAPGLYVSYDDTKTVLDYGFANFSNTQIDNANSADLEITGIEDPQELARIRQADILKRPFSMVGSTQVTLPLTADASVLQKQMDFTSDVLSYSYEGQVVGSVPFTYTREWETEAPAEAQTEPQTEWQTEAPLPDESRADGILESLKAFFSKALDVFEKLYDKMDAFIEKNPVVSAVIGGILLLIFLPLLFLAVTRRSRYQKILDLREEDLQERRRIEEEIERESTDQVEAELRAFELQQRLAQENGKGRAKEESGAPQGEEQARETRQAQETEPADESADQGAETEQAESEAEPEDEYIEVPLDDTMNPPGGA